MKLTLITASSTWNRLFRNGESGLLRLPEDILVDEIFQWLSVRDIARLRLVCKSLALLTKRPAIWKRFLPYMMQVQQPLAPLPPTKTYNLLNLTGHEMETVVTRAISYDKTWKNQIIECQNTFSALAFHHIEETVILPGGHFLVTSVKMVDGQYGLIIWSLEHRATGKPAPLLFRRTEVKAYGLTAKYMMIDGYKSLIVSFLRKRHKESNDTRYIPATFELGGREDQEDPYMPLKYECTVLHVPLQLLDNLNDRKVELMTQDFEDRVEQLRYACTQTGTDLWQSLARIRTGSQLGVTSLDIIDGHPYVCIVKRPDKIVFQTLGTSVRAVLECQPIPEYGQTHHSIWNFRVLPEQNRVLVVRNIDKHPEVGMESDHLVIEMYRIPDEGEMLKTEAASRTHLSLKAYLNVQISEIHRTLPSDDDDSITPGLKRRRVLPPLSLFLRTEKGMAHHSLWPKEERPPANTNDKSSTSSDATTIVTYDLSRSRHIFFGDKIGDTYGEDMDDGVEEDDDERMDEDERPLPRRRKDDAMHFLPGSRRAFVYSIPRNYRSTEPPITACWGFQYNRKDYTCLLGGPQETMEMNMDFAEMELPESPQSTTIEENWDGPYHPSLDVLPSPMKRSTALGPMKLPEHVQERLLYGVSGVCFDEDTGRVVFATKVDNRLHVVDFARTRSRDADDLLHNKLLDRALRREPRAKTFEFY